MIDIGTILRHYKRTDIQEEMVRSAKDREVAVRYGDSGFGKRPDILAYPKDVLEFAKQRSTSFHVSEEHWSNVLNLSPELKPEELNDLRTGWDLVLDIDCPDWDISKITSALIVKSLKDHGIKSISAKFSGNKGFHIGVPLKAFPASIHNKEIKDWFPQGPKRIASFLLDYISEKYISMNDDNEIIISGKYRYSLEQIKQATKKSDTELVRDVCAKCGRIAQPKDSKDILFDFICSRCGYSEVGKDNIKKCMHCSILMEKKEKTRQENVCPCGSGKTVKKFIASAIIDVDTLLISSRHLYRMPYSLHEKSGLASIPIDPEKIMEFEKETAEPDRLIVSEFRFLDDSDTEQGQAAKLVMTAFEHNPLIEEEETKKYDFEREYEVLTSAIPADFFPPCIHNILKGLEDGRKRSMFILINFLSNTGYDYEKIEEILHKWNKSNKEELREVLIKGQIRYRSMQKAKVLPPNCDNISYYKNLQVCKPDNFCPRIKNPVNYTLLKAKAAQNQDTKGRQKLTDEQKEMRRRFREKKKHQEDPGKETEKNSKNI